MTTLIMNNGELAVDTGLFNNGVYSGEVQKWAKVSEQYGGGFVVGCGDFAPLADSLQFLNQGQSPEGVNFSENFSLYWMTREKTCLMLISDGIWQEMPQPVTDGSGHQIAIGALKAGATPSEAVSIVCDVDPFTHGPIDVLRV